VRELAHRNGQDITGLIDDEGGYVWTDFDDFLSAYDKAASVFTRPEDYSALAYTYAAYLSRKGAIYSETFASTDHAERAGVDPVAYLAALTDGIKRAEIDHGIVSRIIPTGVRHFGQMPSTAPQISPLKRQNQRFHHWFRYSWQRSGRLASRCQSRVRTLCRCGPRPHRTRRRMDRPADHP
jgi:hypothetical protein